MTKEKKMFSDVYPPSKLLVGLVVCLSAALSMASEVLPQDSDLGGEVWVVGEEKAVLNDALRLLGLQINTVICGEYVVKDDTMRSSTLDIRFSYTKQEALDKKKLIEKLLEHYRKQYGLVKYEVVDTFADGNYFNVYPAKIEGLDDTSSALGTEITIDLQTATYHEFDTKIMSLLKNAFIGMDMGGNWYATETLSLNVKSEPARTVLCREIREFNTNNTPRFKLMFSPPKFLSWAAYTCGGKVFVNGYLTDRLTPIESNTPVSVILQSEQPLVALVRILQRSGAFVSYEEPTYTPDAIIEKDGTSFRRYGGILRMSFSKNSSVADILFKASAQLGRHFNFGLQKIRDTYVITPRVGVSKEASIGWPQTASLLECSIDINVRNIKAEDCLIEFCKRVSAQTGQKLELGQLPDKDSLQVHYFEAQDTLARSCLSGILNSAGKDLTWEVLYEPQNKRHVLNIIKLGKSTALPVDKGK